MTEINTRCQNLYDLATKYLTQELNIQIPADKLNLRFLSPSDFSTATYQEDTKDITLLEGILAIDFENIVRSDAGVQIRGRTTTKFDSSGNVTYEVKCMDGTNNSSLIGMIAHELGHVWQQEYTKYGQKKINYLQKLNAMRNRLKELSVALFRTDYNYLNEDKSLEVALRRLDIAKAYARGQKVAEIDIRGLHFTIDYLQNERQINEYETLKPEIRKLSKEFAKFLDPKLEEGLASRISCFVKESYYRDYPAERPAEPQRLENPRLQKYVDRMERKKRAEQREFLGSYEDGEAVFSSIGNWEKERKIAEVAMSLTDVKLAAAKYKIFSLISKSVKCQQRY
ncbi:MAG: hypothetical protein V1839_03020 [archaeon]